MKPIYQALLDVFKEMEEMLAKDGKASHLSYSRESVSIAVGLIYISFVILIFSQLKTFDA